MWVYAYVLLIVFIREMRSQCVRHVADYRCPLPRVFAVASEQRPCKSYFPRRGRVRPSMVSAKCIRWGVGPGFVPVSNTFQESQQLLQRLETLCKNGRLNRSGSRVRTIFEPFSNLFRTPISPRLFVCLCGCVCSCLLGGLARLGAQ